MHLAEIIDKLAEIQNRLRLANPEKLRPYIEEQSLAAKRACLVIGPRGIGKTTLLIKESQSAHILYASVDNPLLGETSLSQLAEAAFSQGYEGIIFDEVQQAPSWSQHLKSIYDSFPRKKIWASGSNSLILRKSTSDLTRRFPQINIPFLSFREYLILKHSVNLQTFNPFTATIEVYKPVLSSLNVLLCFKEYLQEGFRPIFLEGDYTEKILAIIEKSIYFDAPFFLKTLQENHLRAMRAMIAHIALSPIPTLNIDALARDWSLGKEKVYDLLEILQLTGLLNIIRYPRDIKASGKGAKIFFADPSMYHALTGHVGNVREAYLVAALQRLNMPLFASKKEQEADFIFDKKLLEVGGARKKRTKSDFVLRDDIEVPGKKIIPLWALGMMV